MQDPTNGKVVNLSTASAYEIKKNFSAFCRRISNEEAGRKYFPRTSVSFASSFGTYAVMYPAEEIEDIEFASQLDRRISGLENKVAATFGELSDKIKAELLNSASDREAIRTSFSDFLKRLNVETVLFFRGEHVSEGQNLFTHIGCGNTTEWAKNFCAGRQMFLREVGRGYSGNKCGYQFYALTCVGK